MPHEPLSSYVKMYSPTTKMSDSKMYSNNIIIIGLFNIAAKGWIEQYAISRM